MRLHLSPGSVARPLRNLGYVPGRDLLLPYTITLDPTDYPLGTTLVGATLNVALDFGAEPLFIKQITANVSASGQITDTGADGTAALEFVVLLSDLAPYRASGPLAYEVTVTDSRGLLASLDEGSLVPTPSTAGAPVDHIVIAPTADRLDVGQTQQLTVTAYDASGNVLIGRTVTYSSANAAVATVSPTGLVTGVAAGSAVITAAVEGKSASSTTSVPPVDHVLVAPDTFSLTFPGTLQLVATPYDNLGNALQNRTVVWTSNNAAVATVDANGLVTAQNAGSAVITATVEGAPGTSAGTISFGTPATPQDLLALYNALGVGGAGAAMRYIWQRGVNMTNAGGKCTRWGDAVGNTVAWTPSADVNSGTGASVGGDGGTSIISAGLELTPTVMDAIMALVTPDNSNYLNNPDPSGPPGVNAGQTLDLLFANHTKGLTVGFGGRALANTALLRLENAADHTNDFTWTPDIYSQWVTLADPLAGQGNVATFNVGGPRTRFGWWLVDTPNSPRGASWNMQQVGRALLNRHKTQSAHPIVGVTGRRLRLGVDGGVPVSAGCEYNVIFVGTGRENKAQNKMVTDYIKARWPDMWEDPRTRAAVLFGDSWQEGIDAPLPGGFAATDIGLAHDVALGHTGRNLARIADCAFSAMAYSGDTIALAQYPLGHLVADMDYSSYTRVAMVIGEYLNGGNPAQNYYLADFCRTIDAKVHTVLMDITYSFSANLPNYPSYNDDIAANFGTHADAVAWLLRGPNSGLNVSWRPRNFGDGTTAAYPTGENPLLWDPGNAFHPGVLFNQQQTPVYQGAVMRGLGDNLATKVVRIMPAAFGLDLVVGGATGTPGAITCYNFADAVITGHTFAYDTVVTNTGVNAGWSSGAAIATVDSSGVVSPVSAGHCLLRIISDDGAVGFVDVNVTGGLALTAQFNGAASSSAIGNADSGQAPIIYGGATFGLDGSGNAYMVTDGGTNNNYAVYNVPGHADTTVTCQIHVVDPEARVTWRRSDANNGFMCQPQPDGFLHVFKQSAGSYAEINYGTLVAWAGAADDIVEVILSGASHTVHIKRGGSTIATASFTDAFNQTATQFGIGANHDSLIKFNYITAS